MRCLYCGKEIVKQNLVSIFIEDDMLCDICRKQLKINHRYREIDNLKIEVLYNYDVGLFKSLLIQYKECYDEALSPVFLYLIKDYINIKYHGYKLLFVPSSKEKLELRGFDHLKLIFSDVKLKHVDGLSMKQELIQEGKGYGDRRKMLNNYVYSGEKLDKVLIVDDVLTSGSSVLGIYRAIKPYATKVRSFVLSCKENAFTLNKNYDKI